MSYMTGTQPTSSAEEFCRAIYLGAICDGEVKRVANYNSCLIEPKQKWFCRRCETIVDMENFKCQCTTSPSPWEPIYQYEI